MKEKYCNCCKQTKPIFAFGKCRSYKDGLTVYCSECTRIQRRQTRQANPEHYKVYQKEYHKHYMGQTPQGYYSRLKNNAKRKNITFEIIIAEFVSWFPQQRLECHYCGQSLERGNGSMARNSLNIDRKDNNRGYSLDNIVIACRRCNSMKGDWLTYGQTVEIAQRYFIPVLRG